MEKRFVNQLGSSDFGIAFHRVASGEHEPKIDSVSIIYNDGTSTVFSGPIDIEMNSLEQFLQSIEGFIASNQGAQLQLNMGDEYAPLDFEKLSFDIILVKGELRSPVFRFIFQSRLSNEDLLDINTRITTLLRNTPDIQNNIV